MKFGKLLLIDRVPEWAEAYIEYNTLKKLLAPAKILQKKFVSATFKDGNIVYHITNRKNLRVEEVVFCIRSFEELIKTEIIKIDKFFMYKLLDLMRRYKFLMINASFIRKSLNTQQREQNESKLKYSFKIFYKELNMVKDYMKLNQTGLTKILKKYSKVVKSLHQTEDQEFNLVKRVQAGKDSTYLARNQDKLLSIMKKTEDSYINYFYPDISQQKNGRIDFRLYTTPKPLSSKQVLFYGILCGVSGILLIFIILQFIQVYSEKPSAIQKTRLTQIFPLFRGNGLFIAYIWLLAWNVHGWQNNHINYKLIFKFNHHFSQMYQILQRASFFTFVYFVCFVWYIILNTPHEEEGSSESINLYSAVDWIDMELLPMFGWLFLLFYIFFPFFKVSFFNPEGRLYFFRLLLDCLKSPFVKMEFKIGWMTDMLVSFAGPLKDFETTLCFYLNKAGGLTNSCNSDSRIIQFLLNIVPTLYRMFQCFRQGYDNKRFWRTWPFYNMLKYLVSLLTSLLSYEYSLNKEKSYLIWWLIVGTFSTLYSFYWDIAQDWGLLKIGKSWKDTYLIGRKLYYGSRNFYLFAIFSNFLLRIVWALNISLGLTEIIDNAMNIPGMFKFIVYFLELYRRCQWNFFRVELEHINNCNKYKAVVDLDLPIKIDPSSLQANPTTLATQSNNVITIQTEMAELKMSRNNLNEIDIESNNVKQGNNLLSPGVNGEFNYIDQISPKPASNRQGQFQEQDGFISNTRHQMGQLSSMGTTGENLKISTNAGMIQSKVKLNMNDGLNEEENEQLQQRSKYQIYVTPCNDEVNINSANNGTQQIESNNNQNVHSQFNREEEKIQSALKLFQDELKKGITSEKTQKAFKVLKQIKPFLKNEQVNQVQIQSEMLAYLDDEKMSLKI